VRMQFVGSAAGAPASKAAILSPAGHLTGPQDQWRTGLPIYGAIAYCGLYAGIDMTYGTNGRQLKSEFAIAAAADSRQIRIPTSAQALRALMPMDTYWSPLLPEPCVSFHPPPSKTAPVSASP
jgi:hypothetical protein